MSPQLRCIKSGLFCLPAVINFFYYLETISDKPFVPMD